MSPSTKHGTLELLQYVTTRRGWHGDTWHTGLLEKLASAINRFFGASREGNKHEQVGISSEIWWGTATEGGDKLEGFMNWAPVLSCEGSSTRGRDIQSGMIRPRPLCRPSFPPSKRTEPSRG